MRLYQTMRGVEADVFVHAGDTIYADNPLKPEVTLDDGRVWKNLVTPEKSKVAETLDEFRGNHRYNLLDEHVRAFNASLSQFAIWDDHEVLNNWYPSEILGADMPYTERRVAVLAARAKRAFLEYTPIRIDPRDPDRVYRAVRVGPLAEIFGFDMRSYRGANSPNVEPTRSPASAILGRAQIEWLERRLLASTATWKVIASDMPLGLVVPDGKVYEAVANRDDGPPLGRELEIADLLRFIRDRGIRNVVFITGDVHYCAAHHYDPSRAGFTDFHPFWEFVAGPAHAGTFGAVPLDRTFGPEVRFIGVPEGHEAESAAERRLAVLRHAAHRSGDAGADGEPAQPRRRDAVQRRPGAGERAARLAARVNTDGTGKLNTMSCCCRLRRREDQVRREAVMRVVKGLVVAGVIAGVMSVAAGAQEQQDADKKVAGGGVTAKGWQGKADPGNKQGLTVNDSKFASEGSGYRVTTGPAGVYWNPANVGKGDFTVKATFKEPKQTYNHPHPFGVFIGGTQLDTDTPSMIYCVAYRDGNYTVRQFTAGKASQVVRRTVHEKVAKAAGQDAEVTQEVAFTVKGDKAECSINGAVVWSGSTADVGGASFDGQTGIRVSHNSDAIVSSFALSK